MFVNLCSLSDRQTRLSIQCTTQAVYFDYTCTPTHTCMHAVVFATLKIAAYNIISTVLVYFHYNMYAIITVSIFDLQTLSDLMMCILLYNEHQERESDYKEMIHYILLFVLIGYVLLNTLSLIYIGDKSGGNDLKATRGVETFAC